MYSEADYNAYKFWNELSVEGRIKFLSENHFWDGLSHYLYDYLPEDIKDAICLKTA